MTLAPLEPNNSFDQERINICRERRRQARVSFDLAWGITAASALVSVIGAAQILLGYITAGSVTASTGVGVSVLCLRFAKDANDRLDKLAAELKDEYRNHRFLIKSDNPYLRKNNGISQRYSGFQFYEGQ